MCSQVLNDDPDNAKILARRGKCSHKLATGKHKHSTVAERKVYARNAEEDYSMPRHLEQKGRAG